eukprot:4157973-Amphidinium_carterae.2
MNRDRSFASGRKKIFDARLRASAGAATVASGFASKKRHFHELFWQCLTVQEKCRVCTMLLNAAIASAVLEDLTQYCQNYDFQFTDVVSQ